MTCSNFKCSTSNSEYENWTWEQWELNNQMENSQPWNCLLGNQELLVLSCGQTKFIFQSMKKRRRNSVQKEGPLKDWEQSQLSASKSYTLSTSQLLQITQTGRTPTQIFVTCWANPITFGEVSNTGNGNEHLQWSRTPWVTATILFWGEKVLNCSSSRCKGVCTPLREWFPFWFH